MRIVNFVQPLSDENYKELFDLTGINFLKDDEIFTLLDSNLENLNSLFRVYGIYIYNGTNFVVLPSDPAMSAKVVAELVGRFGYFPPIVQYELTENGLKITGIINLAEQFSNAKEKREKDLHQR